MKNSQDHLFRSESLERLSSPERLDQLMKVVAPQDWLGLVTLTCLLLLGMGWSIFGKIPVVVTGRGVLVYPHGIAKVQAPTSGILQSFRIKAGDTIHPGDWLGLIDSSSPIVSAYAGQVLEVTAQPGQVIDRGDPLAAIAIQAPSDKLVGLSYISMKDSPSIQSGMTVQVIPDTVSRQQFGSIVGKVRSISSFPVTQQGMTQTIGNAEIAKSLMLPGGQLEMVTDLNLDATTASGYRWSGSRGPTHQIVASTPATMRIIVREQAPITFVLPIFQSVSGLD